MFRSASAFRIAVLIPFLVLISTRADGGDLISILSPLQKVVTAVDEVDLVGRIGRPSYIEPPPSTKYVEFRYLPSSILAKFPDGMGLSGISVYTVAEAGMWPRSLELYISEDGSNFSRIASYQGESPGNADIQIPPEVEGEYVLLKIVAGWDRAVRVTGIVGRDGLGKMVPPSSLLFGPNPDPGLFLLRCILSPGENILKISAFDPETGEKDMAEIPVERLERVVGVVLEDGFGDSLYLDPDSTGLEAASFSRMDPSLFEPIGGDIEEGTGPVAVAEFRGMRRTRFVARASDFLSGSPPSLAFDGNPRYPSTWVAQLGDSPVWIEADLGDIWTINKVEIVPRIEERTNYGPKAGDIECSIDGVEYKKVADITGDIVSFEPTDARILRVTIKKGRNPFLVQISEIRIYDIFGREIGRREEISTLILKKPSIIEMRYSEEDLKRANVSDPSSLSIFIWDSNRWKKLGGKVDTEKRTIRARTNLLGKFGVFCAKKVVRELRWSYNPFSPNGDGIADITSLSFSLTEPKRISVKIFDRNGRLVRKLVDGYDLPANEHMSVSWDGKDEMGKTVEIGPYIYQIEGEGISLNGILVVVK